MIVPINRKPVVLYSFGAEETLLHKGDVVASVFLGIQVLSPIVFSSIYCETMSFVLNLSIILVANGMVCRLPHVCPPSSV